MTGVEKKNITLIRLSILGSKENLKNSCANLLIVWKLSKIIQIK